MYHFCRFPYDDRGSVIRRSFEDSSTRLRPCIAILNRTNDGCMKIRASDSRSIQYSLSYIMCTNHTKNLQMTRKCNIYWSRSSYISRTPDTVRSTDLERERSQNNNRKIMYFTCRSRKKRIHPCQMQSSQRWGSIRIPSVNMSYCCAHWVRGPDDSSSSS